MLLKIAFRNLFRNKRRTLLTGLTMLGAFVFSGLTMGLEDGTYGYVIDQFTRGNSGHLQVTGPGYLGHPALSKTMLDPAQIQDQVRSALGSDLQGVAPRLESEGLLVSGGNVIGVRIVGFDPQAERQTTHLLSQMHFYNGDQPGETRIALTKDLIEKLDLKPEADVVLMSQGADGSIANDRFTVAGEVKDGQSTVFMDLAKTAEFLSAPGQISRLVVVLKDPDETDRAVHRLKNEMTGQDVNSWQVIEDEFYKAMRSDQSAVFITLGVFLFLAAFGILNTVLMNLLERTREFGVMRSLGTRNLDLVKIVALEVAILSVAMSTLGAVISTALNWYLSHHGIPYPKPIEIGGMTLRHLYGHMSFKNVYVPFLIVVGSSILVSLIPAFRAVRLSIVAALSDK